jgi:hypothetical protein
MRNSQTVGRYGKAEPHCVHAKALKDSNLLPLREVNCSLPDDENLIKILTNQRISLGNTIDCGSLTLE